MTFISSNFISTYTCIDTLTEYDYIVVSHEIDPQGIDDWFGNTSFEQSYKYLGTYFGARVYEFENFKDSIWFDFAWG